MATLPVYDKSGSEVGSYDVDPTTIAANINKQLLHDVVIMYQANSRQGSFGTKSRGMGRGSGHKMYRQKGTGNARAGSRRSGVRRGGGHIHKKQDRSFYYRLPAKAVRAATRMAIASKIQDEQITVIDELVIDAPKTKDVAGVLKALGIDSGTTLITTDQLDRNVYKSARNISGVTVSPVADLNALSVLSPDRLLVTKAALDAIVENASAS